jgi:hypothetical protein
MSDSDNLLEKVLDTMPDCICLDWHDEQAFTDSKAYMKRMRKTNGLALKKRHFQPIVIQWSLKGVGFGEYVFFQRDGKIYCDNEAMSRDSVKKVLCLMVDQAIFPEDSTDTDPQPR